MGRVIVPFKVRVVFGSDVVGDNGKDEVRYNCPECINRKGSADTKGHLYVNTKSLVFHCYRCDYSGRIGKINVDKSLIYDEDKDDLETSEFVRKASSLIDDSEEEFNLKIPLDKVTTSKTATEYLLRRGFTYTQMEYYDLRVGNLNQDFGRIIIPNRVVKQVYTDMYTARTYIDQKPKYRNPVDIKKSDIVFNLHRIKEGSPIILVEGSLTAIAAGYHAVASLGKSLSLSQASQILKKNPSSIYVNYDFGAEDQSRAACALLYSIRPDVPIYEVLMKDERDAADLDHSSYVDCLKSAKRYQPVFQDLERILDHEV